MEIRHSIEFNWLTWIILNYSNTSLLNVAWLHRQAAADLVEYCSTYCIERFDAPTINNVLSIDCCTNQSDVNINIDMCSTELKWDGRQIN